MADEDAPPAGSLDDVLGLRVRLAHGAVQRHFGANFADIGLTQKQISVLWLVVDHPGIAQTDLARRLQMDRATTMALVHLLEKQQLVARARIVGDARRVGFHPTAEGERRLAIARRAIAEHEAWLAGRFSAGERAMLARLLRRIYDEETAGDAAIGRDEMQADPRAIIDAAPMSRFQWGVVATMVALNALDGFDVLSISFASPGIAATWGIDRAALGIVLSMELIGMAIGSLVLGDLADRIGRRATILACLAAMTAGMFGAAGANGIVALCVWRVATGLGIGGMLAATNAAVAEAANARRRPLAVTLMAAGYPVGSIVGGTVAAALLAHHDWRAVFVFGGIATLAMVPVVLWRAPESIAFLTLRRPRRAHERINAGLARMGHPPVEALPPAVDAARRPPLAAAFAGGLARTTILLTIAYLAQITTFYFVLKWIPKIVVDQGFAPAAAAGVLVWASAGGLTGSALLGLATTRVGVKPLTVGAALLSVTAVILFGLGHGGLADLSIRAAFAGFATNAAVSGLYALMAERSRSVCARRAPAS